MAQIEEQTPKEFEVFKVKRHFRIYPNGFPFLSVEKKEGKMLVDFTHEGSDDKVGRCSTIQDPDGSIWYKITVGKDSSNINVSIRLSLSNKNSYIVFWNAPSLGTINLIYDPDADKAKME